jgi:hypothetical protein
VVEDRESKMNNNMFIRRVNSETLSRIKRWPSLMMRFKKVRIFSMEHYAYWRGTGQGYTDDRNASSIWDMEEAFKVTKHCGKEKQIMFTVAGPPYE